MSSPTGLTPVHTRSPFHPTPTLGVLPSTGCDVLVVDESVHTDTRAGEADASQTCEELPGCRVAAWGNDRASDQVLAVGSEVTAALVSDATTVVAEVPLGRRVCLGEGQSAVFLPIDALSARDHGGLRRSVSVVPSLGFVLAYHVSVADEGHVIGEGGADASDVRWAVGGSVSSDPEVVARGLDRLAAEVLVRVAGGEGEGSAGLSWLLREVCSVAAGVR